MKDLFLQITWTLFKHQVGLKYWNIRFSINVFAQSTARLLRHVTRISWWQVNSAVVCRLRDYTCSVKYSSTFEGAVWDIATASSRRHVYQPSRNLVSRWRSVWTQSSDLNASILSGLYLFAHSLARSVRGTENRNLVCFGEPFARIWNAARGHKKRYNCICRYLFDVRTHA